MSLVMPMAAAPRVGLRAEMRTTPAGEVALSAEGQHVLKIHAGAPVRGTCRSHHFVYSRGDIDIFPVGSADVWHEREANTSLLVHVSPALLRRAAEDTGRDPDRAGLEPRHQIRDPQIEHIAWALDADRQAGHPGGLLYTESLGLALAVHLLVSHAGPAPAPPRALNGAQLARLTEHIEAHLDRNLSLDRLARVAGMSASHLKTLFRRATGLPLHRYVVQRRVERARTLLRQGELSTSQVALEAGFAHQSHLARWMRRLLGVTPGAVARTPRPARAARA
jgi:AraC family transcriptional regulator